MKLSQKARLVILALYAILLFSVCRFLFGAWLPPSAEKGLWLYASLAHLLLGTLLLSPYFTKPADAVSDAVIAAIVLPEIYGAVLSLNRGWALVAWKSAFAYYVVVIVLGIFAMILRGSRSIWKKPVAESLYILSTELGETSLVFSILFFFALFVFHLENMREFVTLTAAWVIIVPLRLLERVVMLSRELLEVWSGSVNFESVGEPCARKEPSLLLLRRTAEGPLPFGQVLTMRLSAEEVLHHAMIIDEFQLADGRWIRCFEIAGQFSSEIEKKLGRVARMSLVFKLDTVVEQSEIDSAFNLNPLYSSRANMIGLVAANTDITTLRFELTRTDLEIGEGQPVGVTIGSKQVLYQIINGFTQEEILAQKDTYGFARGSAKKIGSWNENGNRFEHVRWIPRLNEPVFLQQAETSPDDATAIGFFPSTRYPVSIDVQQLVTHNAAILGILGAGKTYLALELVERMMLAGIKVIALDLTNQYPTRREPKGGKRFAELDDLGLRGGMGYDVSRLFHSAHSATPPCAVLNCVIAS
jgi:uncharacterized protein